MEGNNFQPWQGIPNWGMALEVGMDPKDSTKKFFCLSEGPMDQGLKKLLNGPCKVTDQGISTRSQSNE